VGGSSPEPVTYDAAGNETSMGRFSPRNLLSQVTKNPISQFVQTINYAYDGRGVRLTAAYHNGGGRPADCSRRFLYSPEFHLLARSTCWDGVFSPGNPMLTTEYVWLDAEPVAQLPADPQSPIQFTFTDHLG